VNSSESFGGEISEAATAVLGESEESCPVPAGLYQVLFVFLLKWFFLYNCALKKLP